MLSSSSCAGLTRASMRQARQCGEAEWIAGSSPGNDDRGSAFLVDDGLGDELGEVVER
jgi:hypothetical protein